VTQARALPWMLLAVAACSSGTRSATVPDGPGPDDGEPETVADVVAPTHPEGFRYALMQRVPFTYHRFDSVITIHPGGATQLQTFGHTAYLKVTVRDSLLLVPQDSLVGSSLDSVQRYVAHFTLDSIRQDRRSSLPQPALDSVRGARWSVITTPRGGVGTITVSDGSSIGENLSGELARLFFPIVPQSGAAIGTQWTDSTEAKIGGRSVSQTERSAIAYFVPIQDLTDQPVLRIEARAEVERRGSEDRDGRIIELAGTGIDSTSYFLGPHGRFLGAEGADSVAMTFTVPAVGQSVPVYQMGHYRLEQAQESHNAEGPGSDVGVQEEDEQEGS
jgi:hypothetical protein